ncbi:hypothetical protein D5071_06630 [Pectobacterium carotovorum]|uniref:Uncharacterized protein n=1 Tax=Pectobacterium carotovorum TaxID=554 RepID=A0A419AYG8_PECCA|nr:hypothetical protein D5071_06630 [Pectobacterium carotovorum]
MYLWCEFIVNARKREISKLKCVLCVKKMSVFAYKMTLSGFSPTIDSNAQVKFINTIGVMGKRTGVVFSLRRSCFRFGCPFFSLYCLFFSLY